MDRAVRAWVSLLWQIHTTGSTTVMSWFCWRPSDYTSRSLQDVRVAPGCSTTSWVRYVVAVVLFLSCVLATGSAQGKTLQQVWAASTPGSLRYMVLVGQVFSDQKAEEVGVWLVHLNVPSLYSLDTETLVVFTKISSSPHAGTMYVSKCLHWQGENTLFFTGDLFITQIPNKNKWGKIMLTINLLKTRSLVPSSLVKYMQIRYKYILAISLPKWELNLS